MAEKAFDFFLEADGPKYDKAVACLAKDRDALLAFYDFPAEHWKHIRTTNPIERAVLHQSPDKRGVPLPVKMVSQLTQTWHSQVRSFC